MTRMRDDGVRPQTSRRPAPTNVPSRPLGAMESLLLPNGCSSTRARTIVLVEKRANITDCVSFQFCLTAIAAAASTHHENNARTKPVPKREKYKLKLLLLFSVLLLMLVLVLLAVVAEAGAFASFCQIDAASCCCCWFLSCYNSCGPAGSFSAQR